MPDIDQLPPNADPSSQPDAGSGGVPQGGTPASGKPDAATSIDSTKFVPVADLNKLRSTMDRQLAQQKQQFDALNKQYQELQAWREQNETEGLTDEELAAYMAEKKAYEADRKIAEANQRLAQTEYEKNVMALKQYYLSFGAPADIARIDDPSEMQDALLRWYQTELKKAQTEAEQLRSGAPDSKDKQPPPVTTHKPAAGSLGKVKLSEMKLGSKEEAEVLAKLEAGLLKPEDIA